MEQGPIFVATHTRSCSTAFERVFMTRRDLLTCFHEPFGDAFYYGPEKISPAWLRWEAGKIEKTGRAHYTYDHVLQSMLNAVKDSGKRAFIKDMSYHIIPPSHSPNATAPSVQHRFDPGDHVNPTLFPTPLLQSFKFVFLIRDPSASIPSLYRCFLPPLSEKTGEHFLDPTELGYRETRILFDYLSTATSQRPCQTGSTPRPILVDADDLLSNPEAIIHSVCTYLDLPYSSSMLSWSTSGDHAHAVGLFEKYAGYHEDALNSTGLRGKTADREAWGKQAKTIDEENAEWKERYGEEAAREIRAAVDLCRDDYEYLRQFRITPEQLEA